MAESQRFFSWMIDGLASYVRQQVGMQGRTDQRRQNNAFSWYDRQQQHNATSTGCGWNDQRQRHGASSLSWSTVWLFTCDGESACKGWTDQRQQYDAFSWYDWWRQHKATSSRRRWTDRRQRHGASSLGWLTVWLVTCNGESACVGGLIIAATRCFFSLRSTAVTQSYFTWLVDAGREHLPLPWCDRQNSDACRNKTLYKGRNS